MNTPTTRILPLRSIRPDPANPRFDLGDLTHLTEDIRDNGLIHPLVVRPGSWGKRTGECRDCGRQVRRTPTGVLEEHQAGQMPCPGGSEPAADDWILLAGHRRHASCLAAGLWEVPAVTRFDIHTSAEALVLMMRENSHRRDLTPLEEAHGYQQLLDLGLTATKVAQEVHRSKKTIDRRLALNGLKPGARKKLMTGVITLQDAEALLDLPPERAERAEASLGTREFRQEVAAARMVEAGPEEIAARLRGDFLGPFLAGTQRPPVGSQDRVLRAVVGSLTDALPRRVVRAWCDAVGVTEPVELTTVPPVRALIGAAVVGSTSTAGVYDLLEALGYEPSPIELDLIEKASA